MLTVPEAARRAGRNPETIRRWIRDGRLRARKVGTQHVIDEEDLAEQLGSSVIPAPEGSDRTATGEPMPDFVAARRDMSGGDVLSVPEAAERVDRDPETVRRWIRQGRLRARKVGTQHFIDVRDLEGMGGSANDVVALPQEWRTTFWGAPMPDIVAALRRSRAGH